MRVLPLADGSVRVVKRSSLFFGNSAGGGLRGGAVSLPAAAFGEGWRERPYLESTE